MAKNFAFAELFNKSNFLNREEINYQFPNSFFCILGVCKLCCILLSGSCRNSFFNGLFNVPMPPFS